MNGQLSTEDQITLARTRLWSPELDRLLRRWKDQIGKRQIGHAKQARKFSRRHYIIGVPSTLLSAIVTTGVLSTFRKCDDCANLDSPKCEADQWIRLAMGIFGLLAAALAALMTFMNYQESAEQHKNAASDFENLHRVLETLLQVPGSVRGDPVATLQNLRDQYTVLVRGAPQLPKEYAVDLTHPVGRNENQGPKPPQPSQICINNQGPSIPLRKLLESEEERSQKGKTKKKGKTRRRLKKSLRKSKASSSNDSQGATESSDDEIVIGFDLDTAQSYPGNRAALTAAFLAAEKEGQVQRSLSRALELELQRLDTHIQVPTDQSEPEIRSPRPQVIPKPDNDEGRSKVSDASSVSCDSDDASQKIDDKDSEGEVGEELEEFSS